MPPPGPEQAASPYTALMVQENISQVVAMVRPAVVSVLRPAGAQMAANSSLTYINPYPSGSGPMGSGVIIDARGFILTTFQTVGQATQVTVTLFSGKGREYVADVLDVDTKTDLALLQIRDGGPFPTVQLGNSDLIETGDIAFAVGSPFGFSRTVTMGIVSSIRRQLSINGVRYPDMIQTDAAINAGNDGGPLVNIKGEVIGINVACYMMDDNYSGIGFAIPANDFQPFIGDRLR